MPSTTMQPRQQPLQTPQPIALPELQGGQTYSSVNQNEYADFIKQMMSFANSEGGFNIPLLDFLGAYFNKPDFGAYVLSPPASEAGFMDQRQGLTFEQGKEIGEGLKSLYGKATGQQPPQQLAPGHVPPPAIQPGQPPKGYTPPLLTNQPYRPFTPNKSFEKYKSTLPYTRGIPKFPSEGGPGADKWQKWLDELKQQGASPGVPGPGNTVTTSSPVSSPVPVSSSPQSSPQLTAPSLPPSPLQQRQQHQQSQQRPPMSAQDYFNTLNPQSQALLNDMRRKAGKPPLKPQP